MGKVMEQIKEEKVKYNGIMRGRVSWGGIGMDDSEGKKMRQ